MKTQKLKLCWVDAKYFKNFFHGLILLFTNYLPII